MKTLSIRTTQRARRSATAFACVCALCSLFCSCGGDSELNALLEGQGENPDSQELVEINIGSAATLVYNGVETNSNQPQSRSNDHAGPQSDYLIDEYVGVPHFRPTRSGEDPDYEGPRIATMSVRADSANQDVQTRAISVGANIVFRVIVFVNNGGSYTFSSAADYKVTGSNAPTLVDSNKKLKAVKLGSTIRVVAFSENSSSSLSQIMPSSYSWGDAISISKFDRDFITFDSGDKLANAASLSIPISFSHQLAKLTVSMSATGFSSNTITGIGTTTLPSFGTAASWSIGATAITASNTSALSIPAFSSTSPYTSTIRVLPQSAKKVQASFSAITVGGKALGQTTISSNANLTISSGKTYTMAITFKKAIGINLPASDINLGSNCTTADKSALSKLRWAEGNLNSTGSSNYSWVNPSATGAATCGYYYTYYSTYTGNSSQNNTDPCTKLQSSYGTGWKTPSIATTQILARCTDKKSVTYRGQPGLWFLNSSKGLFLPMTGYYAGGSGTAASYGNVSNGYYRVRDGIIDNNTAYIFMLGPGSAGNPGNPRNIGAAVRCVKGD